MAETILIVDDEKNIRRTVRMVLEGEGYSVREAGSAKDSSAICGGDSQGGSERAVLRRATHDSPHWPLARTRKPGRVAVH